LTQPIHWDAVVLGAGAAGMMCAFEAGRRGKRVLLLDHGDRVGRKILISGGGRANFTNVNARAENYISANPHFAKSALAQFTPADMIALVRKHNISFHEKTLGQLFCDRSARDLVTLLERECAEAHVQTRCGVTVHAVRREEERFELETTEGPIHAAALVVATGGLSIPKIGATSFGYELAKQFGHNLVETRPALVPLVFAPADRERWCDLTGLSAEVIAQAEATAASRGARSPQFREKMLITHRGLSGPAVLQASSYWMPGRHIAFDLAPGREVFRPLLERNARRDRAAAFGLLRELLPQRLAERWINLHTLEFTNAGIARMESELHAWRVLPAGTEGYAKAEVTAGGINTDELNARTLESRRLRGLYFIGEVVDVTGWLGGYNFQWAWASAVAASRAL
jgi:hypothetical protein